MSTASILDTPTDSAVVVALDHGLAHGSMDGFENPRATLETVLEGRPDGVLVGPHFARHHEDAIRDAGAEILLTADSVMFSTRPGHEEGEDLWTPAFDTESLLDLDPAGVKTVLVFGRDDTETFRRNVEYVAALSSELRGTGVPLVVEPVMWGSRVPEQFETDADLVADASRIAWEHGADILKIPYTGSRASFEPIVRNAPVPSMILGGPAADSTREVLGDVEEAVGAGSRGVIIGRSIWKSDDPAGTIEAMKAIVHEGATVADVA